MTIQNKLISLGMWGEIAEQVCLGDITSGLTAAGTTQADALAISADANIFGTVASGTGAVLAVSSSARILVRNGGANALLVYAPVGGTMNGTSNGSLSIATTKNALFVSADGVNWYSILSA
jgi:hypothetical protein